MLWVWVVGELYSGCLHLYFCVICGDACASACLSVCPFGVGVLVGCVCACFCCVCCVCLCLFSFVGRSVDALALRADEGRCGLRYASGSWRASVDPRVSEWGNLARVVSGYLQTNFVVCVGGTRGSETS